jgi:hypothetical protein
VRCLNAINSRDELPPDLVTCVEPADATDGGLAPRRRLAERERPEFLRGRGFKSLSIATTAPSG